MTETATYKELRRSRDDRMLGGVCGGLGRYFDVNPVFYRVGFVVLTLFGGAGILAYGAALLVIPNEGEQESIASDVLRNHRQRPVALIGLVLVAAAGMVLLANISWRFDSDVFWVIVLLGGGLLLWSQRRQGGTPPPPLPATPGPEGAGPGPPMPFPPPAGPVTPPPPRRQNPLLVALGAVGVLIALLIVAAVAFASPFLHLGDGVGDRAYAPSSVGSLRDEYRLGVGELELDLSNLSLPPGTTTIEAGVGIGRLHVIVPQGVTVRTMAHVSWGEARVLGHEEDGHNVRTDVGSDSAQLVLDTDVGIGQIEVERAVR
jgi:phage shock protein PspC (stress-responsive transcriptional regulator)